MIERIISGGQTGADRGALDAAIRCCVPHGGWCPRGRRAEDGRISSKYQLVETEDSGYVQRTHANIRGSSATLIVVRDRLTPGSRMTRRYAGRQKKAVYVARVPDMASVQQVAHEMRMWLTLISPHVLNVAGSRESKAPGLQLDTEALVSLILAF